MDNKGRLLDEALTLFSRRGVDAVGVQEIVDAAGVTKPTLYHHFGSKDGLVRAVVDRGFTVLNASLDSLGPYDRDLAWYLERQAGLWIDAVRFQPGWFRLELALTFLPGENIGSEAIRPGQRALQHRMESLFELASEQYGNMRGRHRLLASGWIGTLNHWTALYLGSWAELDETHLREGTRLFLYGIFT